MGCFTWTYNRLDIQPTQDEIREKVIKNFTRALEEWIRWREIKFKNIKPTKEERELLNFRSDYSNLDKINYWIKYCKRCLKKIKAGKAEKAIRKRYALIENLFYFNDEFYGSVNYHIPFRSPNYPENILTCYDDFILFYLNPENHCYLSSDDITEKELDKRMLDFWKQYPHGIIHFG